MSRPWFSCLVNKSLLLPACGICADGELTCVHLVPQTVEQAAARRAAAASAGAIEEGQPPSSAAVAVARQRRRRWLLVLLGARQRSNHPPTFISINVNGMWAF